VSKIGTEAGVSRCGYCGYLYLQVHSMD
jgi:hypothetical protein